MIRPIQQLACIVLLAPSPLSAQAFTLDEQFEARQLVAHKCWKCHGSERDDGDIRLHTRKAILDSGAVDLKHPEKSELLRRINLPEGHKEIMPSEGKPLSQEQVKLLSNWIKHNLPWDGRGAFREAPLKPRQPAPVPNSLFSHQIDQRVDAYFKRHQIMWQEAVPDKVFVRRAYLDTIGLLPSPAQAEAFINDKNPDKRSTLVTNLLNQNPDYVLHWQSFWNDLLRNDYTGTGFITGGRKHIFTWLHQSLRQNKPYDVMVRELLSTNKKSHGFIGGIRWRGTVSASQTVEMQAAQNSAQLFLGLNLKCASCHDAFTSNWSLQQSHEFAAIFAPSGSIDIHRCDKPRGDKAKSGFLFQALGNISPTAPLEQRLTELGNLITHPENGRFARTIVNRFWAHLLGRGLIANVDEMDQSPWDQDLLDDLSYRFAAQGHDTKWLIHEIMTSRAYQLPATRAVSRNKLIDNRYIFKGPVIRRLRAEQLADAFSTLVAPVYGRAIDGRITRASEKPRDSFQSALGRPNRDNITTIREENGNLLEALELTNGLSLDSVLKTAATAAHQKHGNNISTFIQSLFSRGLLRPANKQELALLSAIYNQHKHPDAYYDILWIFINLPEFQTLL